MRLQKASSWFFALVLLVLGGNALFLVLITRAYDTVVAAQNHRRSALALSSELQRETEQLARLVRAYTSTGEARYLLYYYDILAVRQGEKAGPDTPNPVSYWDDVIAGRIKHRTPPDGSKRSLTDLMKSQGFTETELSALRQVLAATAAMNEVEQKAFAATQGLYDPDLEKYVSDGVVRLDYASALVHSTHYNELKADLSAAVGALFTMIDQRTGAEVSAAGVALERWILLSLVSMAVTTLLGVLALRGIRRNMLDPMRRLGRGTDRLAAGDYSTRAGVLGGFDELGALGRTVDVMAQAIEDDIARRAVIQKELETTRQQAQDATHAKSRFLANMSHEIRTPMNAILGMAYLALRTDLSPRQHDYVGKIHNAAKDLLGVINDILDFSKVEAGKLELECAPFRLEDVVRQSLVLVHQRAREKGIELVYAVSSGQLVGDGGMLMGDAMRLGQVLTNLLSNAVKFTHRGHVRLAIALAGAHAGSTRLRFTVQDTGIGLSPGQWERLFDEFTQADGSTTRKYGGTGLGLTISRRLVELMGGSIGVDSEQGAGACFHFTACFQLPSGPAPVAPLLSCAGGLRVLVVDPARAAFQALQDQLTAVGVAGVAPGLVEWAQDGEQAAIALRRAGDGATDFDLVLIDEAAPGLDSPRLGDAIAPLMALAPAGFVRVSANDPMSRPDTPPWLGRAPVLSKPVLPTPLREMIVAVCDPARQAVVAPGPASPARGRRALAGMHVLLVEDHPVNRQLVMELLEGEGALVDLAANGAQGLERVRTNPPGHFDAVLLDLQMPVMDGYEVARLLRLDPQHSQLPIIALTAHAMEGEMQRCRELGMNGHLGKPIDPQLLFETLAPFRPSGAEQDATALPQAVAETAKVPAESPLPPDWLPQLLGLLERGDIDAKAYWAARQDAVTLAVPARVRQDVSNALAAYDLERAAEVLRRWQTM